MNKYPSKIEEYFLPGELERLQANFKRYQKSRFWKKIGHLKSFKNRIFQTVGFIFKDQKLIAHVIKAFGWKILGKPSMRSLEIAVEYNCNSKCEQCSCRLAYDPSRPRLTVDEFKNAIDQAIALGAFQFNITGGEPLLQFEDVKEILKYIKSKKGYSHICSNGLIMTEEKLDALVKAGLNSIEMGLDSAVPAIHDGNRRENGFEKIMQVIEWAKEKKLTIILNTISTHEKIENGDLLALYKLAKQKGVYVQVTPPCVTGAWKNKTEILLDKDETDYFWWLMTFPRMRTDMYSSFTSVRCPAVREKIGIQPYGDVVSCPLVQIVYGNIKQESLKSIRDKMLQNPYYLRVSTCLPAFDREFIDKYLIEK